MSSQHPVSHSSRIDLIEAVMQAIRDNSTTAVFFHTSIAEQVGLGATEEKTLFILRRFGPLTAGEIARHTGLTTPSVTSLIDRLESKGFVQRVRDTRDRRRVIVEQNEERFLELTLLWGAIQEKFVDFLEIYNDDQLMTIKDFLTRATQWSQEYIDTLYRQESKT